MMLEPQSTELPSQTEYLLDQAVEASELDMGSRMVLIVYGDRTRIEGIVGGGWTPAVAEDGVIYLDRLSDRRWKFERQRKGVALMAYAGELLADLDPLRRAGALLLGTAGLLTMADGLAECFSGWAIEDSCEGGALEPFDRSKRTPWQHMKRDRLPFKRVGRRLHAPKWMRRYVGLHQEEGPGQMRSLWNAVKARSAEARVDVDAAWTVFDEDFTRMRERLRQRERVQMARIMAEGIPALHPRKVTYKIARADRIALRQKRKAAIRSAIFAAGLLGAGTVSAFAAGRTVHIAGQDAILEIAKRGSIYASNHAALEIVLLDKSRAKLADLCLYVQDTPAIDQLAALALAMEAGEERELIATANITKIAPAGIGHALLAEKYKATEHARDAIIPYDAGALSIYEARRLHNATYWAETKDIWIDTLGTYVFNRDWKRVRSLGRKDQRMFYA